LSVSGFYLPQSYVGLTRYGARAAVQAGTRHVDYWILIPVRGWLATSVRGQEFLCDPWPVARIEHLGRRGTMTLSRGASGQGCTREAPTHMAPFRVPPWIGARGLMPASIQAAKVVVSEGQPAALADRRGYERG
jgi:hypothetical protein